MFSGKVLSSDWDPQKRNLPKVGGRRDSIVAKALALHTTYLVQSLESHIILQELRGGTPEYCCFCGPKTKEKINYYLTEKNFLPILEKIFQFL